MITKRKYKKKEIKERRRKIEERRRKKNLQRSNENIKIQALRNDTGGYYDNMEVGMGQNEAKITYTEVMESPRVITRVSPRVISHCLILEVITRGLPRVMTQNYSRRASSNGTLFSHSRTEVRYFGHIYLTTYRIELNPVAYESRLPTRQMRTRITFKGAQMREISSVEVATQISVIFQNSFGILDITLKIHIRLRRNQCHMKLDSKSFPWIYNMPNLKLYPRRYVFWKLTLETLRTVKNSRYSLDHNSLYTMSLELILVALECTRQELSDDI